MFKRPLLDFHSHILPGMDDGARLPTESVEMLLSEKKAGITDVCLTSHYYADENTISSYLNRRQYAYDRLRSELKETSTRHPNLHLSAEVHYFKGMAEAPLLDMLCCGASDLILVEPPMREWDGHFYGELDRLQNYRGLRPVIAHLDRYVSLLGEPTLIEDVRSRGYLVQFNIEAFLDKNLSRYSFELLRHEKIDFLGSDAHDMSSRPVEMKEFLRVLDKEQLKDRFYSLSEKGIRLLRGINSISQNE